MSNKYINSTIKFTSIFDMASENFYVVKRTLFNPRDPAEQSFHVTVPATCTDLNVAKKEAKMALTREGYKTDFFSVYDVNNGRDG